MRKKKALTFQQALFLSARNVDLRFRTSHMGYINQEFDSFNYWINEGLYSQMCSQKWYIQEVNISEKHEDVKQLLSRNLDVTVKCNNYECQTISSIAYWEKEENINFSGYLWKLDKYWSNKNIIKALKLMRK